MVATDTVVGILGALVLVAVMVGVFVYEYNSVEEQQGDGFAQRYPFLEPGEDLDGDGVPNAQDGDLDGDDVPNAQDGNVSYHAATEVGLGRDPGPGDEESAALAFPVVTGNRGLEATATWEATVTPPLPTQPSLTVELVLANETRTAQVTYDGSTATAAFDIEEGLPTGEAELRVRTNDGSLAEVTVALEVHVRYGP